MEEYPTQKTSESFPELPQNTSLVHSEGSMLPFHSFDDLDLCGYPHTNSEDGMTYFKIFKDPEKQFIVSELIGTVIPRAPIVQSESHFDQAYFSLEAEAHPDFTSETDKREMLINKWFLHFIFDDEDHSVYPAIDYSHNIAGSIFYDFHQATFVDQENLPQPSTRIDAVKYVFKDASKETISIFTHKVELFKKTISGESGLQFIAALLLKARYTEISPGTLQTNLLNRCDQVLNALDTFAGR